MSRPPLTPSLDPMVFRQNRWLKAELMDFCAAHGLPTDGTKHHLRKRITRYLSTRQTSPEPLPSR